LSAGGSDPLPYAGLDPARIIAAVETLGLACDGRIFALNSYENRVFRIGIEDGAPLVAKFYRPGRWSDAAIVEEHDFAFELRAAELSVVAPLRFQGRSLHVDGELRYALFPLQGGHAPEPGDEATLVQIGRTLGRLHNVGAMRPFRHRPALDIEAMAEKPAAWLLDAGWIPPSLEDNFAALCNLLLDGMELAFERAGEVATLRLHGDCHPGNLLWREDAVHFVDLDDALAGPAMQDLWMLLSGDRHARAQQLAWLLEGYEVFRPFDRRELHLIEALRGLRLLHYHAWIARRWSDPAFPAAFPWFESPRHWEGVLVQLQEQLDSLREPVLALP
jgi:Ser/Thr protein kinase RdoA (MazF antagonist)